MVYLNNIIIYLNSEKEYKEYIEWVLKRLYKENMLVVIKKYFKLNKLMGYPFFKKTEKKIINKV